MDNRFGKSFPPAAVFVGYVFLIIGIVAFFSNPLVGLVFSLVSVIVAFTVNGFQIINLVKK